MRVACLAVTGMSIGDVRTDVAKGRLRDEVHRRRFHDALRKELGDEGIRVSVLEPGAVWTEFGENVSDALLTRRTQLEAMQSEDVAQALVFAFAQPANVLIQEILMRPVKQIAP